MILDVNHAYHPFEGYFRLNRKWISVNSRRKIQVYFNAIVLLWKSLIIAIKGIDFRPEVHTGSRTYAHLEAENDFDSFSNFHNIRITSDGANS